MVVRPGAAAKSTDLSALYSKARSPMETRPLGSCTLVKPFLEMEPNFESSATGSSAPDRSTAESPSSTMANAASAMPVMGVVPSGPVSGRMSSWFCRRFALPESVKPVMVALSSL